MAVSEGEEDLGPLRRRKISDQKLLLEVERGMGAA